MKDLELIFSVFFIVSPIIGFIPQIYTNKIIFPELLSIMTICANIFKILHYSQKSLISVIPIQGLFVIALHICLIFFNKSVYSVIEEKILKRLRINGKKGYILYICITLISAHFIGKILRIYELCGFISLVFEVGVNVFQLIIEQSSKNFIVVDKKGSKQKELYLVWLVGDICRILFMVSVVTPWMYTTASFIQLGIDGYLLYH